ncbi:MAG: phospholipase [Chloroflexota bacterium]
MTSSHRRRNIVLAILAVLIIAAVVAVVVIRQNGTVTYQLLAQDTIINADLWSSQPEIFSAGYGFDNIIGVDGGETEVRATGGTWNTVTCSNGAEPPRSALTSSATKQNVTAVFDHTADHADGLPVVFSYPILPSTLDNTDFKVTLNTGETLTPDAASIFPNFEYNERHVAVIFGQFGNRLLPGEDGARYTIRVEVVADNTPLMLVGPNGLVSAVGLFKDSDKSPYESGPYLVGAKLNRISTEGEGGPKFLSANLPNDGKALYGDAAQYRLRVFTSGGFSPDGVQGVRPDEYERFFRIHATGTDGENMLLTKVGANYAVEGGNIRVLGLADLGLAESSTPYDDCYVEDHDNYIDIILAGDETAMRHITAVEIPAKGDYDPFYNPGGPGNNPTPNIRYTAPGPADLEPVIIALDDPMTVSYGN